MIHERRASLRTAGSIAGAVLVAIIALALHPHFIGHPAPQAELREMGTLSARDRLVHGTLLFLIGVLLIGFVRYALSRGVTRQPVVAGLVSFAVGIGGLFAAGLVDGFILPELAARFVAAPPASQVAVVTTLTACSVAVNVLTAFAITAMAIAISAWSLDLAHDPGESRVAGIVGFVSAALTVAALVVSGPSLNPHTLMAVVGAQGVWYVWIAVLFARGHA
jgi:hypothetical protein